MKHTILVITAFFLAYMVTSCKNDKTTDNNDAKFVHLTYYVSNATGNDANDGLSPETAWKSLDKVNTYPFEPGDVILFRGGDEWKGLLRPQGSGAEGKPICIDKYGEGALPKINQDGRKGAVVQLENQEYWEINRLEVTAISSPAGTDTVVGINVIATTVEHVLKHIVIRECVIRNINGNIDIYECGGIWVGVPEWGSSPAKPGVHNLYGYDISFKSSFDGVLIENNQIYNVSRTGILVWTTSDPSGLRSTCCNFMSDLIPSKNVVVRGNIIEDIGGDAIIIMGSDAPLVEKNVVRRCCKTVGNKPGWGNAAAVWFHHCLNGIIQHNAVYDTKKNYNNNDGMAYDFDMGCKGCIVQYNYSRNNSGGFLLVMPDAVDNIARYNISENDQTHVLFLEGRITENNLVYNNTFYMGSGSVYFTCKSKMINNIFMLAGNAQIELRDANADVFQQNCYTGNWTSYPNDLFKITADPKFQNPGNGGENAENLACYTPDADSPCRDMGKIMVSNGGRDILGNPVSAAARPDLGAIQHQ
jgi:hypothetical protein